MFLQQLINNLNPRFYSLIDSTIYEKIKNLNK